MRRLLSVAAIGALLLAGPLPAAASGQVIPVDAVEFQAVLEKHRGSVVLVNFWATWCAPCLHEIPALLSVEDRLAEAGFVFVPLSMDDPSVVGGVLQDFIDRWFPGFTTWLRREPDLYTAARLIDPDWNEILPTTYVLDRDGAVVRRLQGARSEDELLQAVQAVLDGR